MNNGKQNKGRPGFRAVFTILPALLFQLNLASGQAPAPGNAAPGLRLPSDTARPGPIFFSLPAPLTSSGNRLASAAPDGPAKAPDMPRAYSYEKLGAFCKWEVQLEKAARMPVKFRLGEVQYVERMEGKLPDY